MQTLSFVEFPVFLSTNLSEKIITSLDILICRRLHLKIAESKTKTILGRVIDSSNLLSTGANNLAQAAVTAKEGTEQETVELHQVSTAVEEMVATIGEVAQNTTFTSQKVGQAHLDCEIATKAMQLTMDKVNVLAQEVANLASSATELADSCVDKATEAHDVVNKVYSLISDISDLAIQISTASEEPSMVSQEISRNIINISDASQNNFNQVNTVESETMEIKIRANALAALGQAFHG
jgi:methyl-accepting chemotaxis protein